ncbi:Xaa-Pro dipeptidyl-peptidase [Nocardioides euryhalodurans]|uniref:Xaa-Pro dipeptidyl-peptidase n=1 Tax=Nocardioides euryhalodurans TaxID=2518370 RepID=A0A4P7GGR2_9ACTN|nr:Xaa-Pro dipeptidyl-peptidase [Nocardioides euryhalodurans]QBR91006.1 Xaa-Pro dipeptidyl-peptidase [Nocardioides euryhalodurans]
MRRFVALVLTSALALVALTPAEAAPRRSDRPAPPPWLQVEDGMTQPQFDLAEAVEETLWVQTTVDSDLDGRNDRVRIRLSRPAETETEGIEVPVIFEHSPYRSNTGGGVNHGVDFARMPQEGIQPRSSVSPFSATPVSKPDLPGSLDNYWVPRGYAVVLGESIGTGFSDGCATVGDMKETLGTRAVIDWLNGRAAAYDEAGNPVEADWTTGDVGMTGVSYNGTLPNQVATTGVEGLRTIVPVSAIASWYDYYRANGLVRAPHSARSGVGTNAYLGEDLDVLADYVNGPTRVEKCRHVVEEMLARQDRVTGDYNAYWAARDYLPKADDVQASVFVVHGLGDYNVMPRAFASWWEELGDARVPRKIWLHNGGHGGPGSTSGYQDTLNRWMAHWLFGVPNGVMDEPRADVQRPDGTYEQYADWPAPGSRPATLHLGATQAAEPGTLDLRPQSSGPRPRQSFTDNGRALNTDASLIQGPDTANPHRLAYLSPPLRRAAHLSGTPEVSLRASVDNRYAANLTAVVVDYGPVGSTAPPVMVTRGWTDVQNRRSVDRSTPIQQGREYTFRWELEPDDHVFPAGHRIGLVVVSTDQQFTVRPDPGTELTVSPGRSSLTLPVVGGARTLRR